MTANAGSQVYNVWRALTRLLREIEFDTIAENPDGVAVWFGDPTIAAVDQEVATERAVVVGGIDTPDQEWGPIGQLARNEEFGALIVVTTNIPGRTAEEARDRLETLTSAIETMVRNSVRTGTRPEETDEHVWQWGVVRVRPLVVPAAGSGAEGYVGTADVLVACKARI